jgi:hypothetical protein
VDEYAKELLSTELELVREGFYSNSSGQVGYYAVFSKPNLYIWFSVSATEVRIPARQVATALELPTRSIQRSNPYRNTKGQQGFEATVRSLNHAFMLGASPDYPQRQLQAWIADKFSY